jgi:adenylate cyclase
MQQHTYLKSLLLAISSLVILFFFTRIVASDAFYSYEAKTYDWRVAQSVSDRHIDDISEVMIIDVDDRAIDQLGSFYRWPKDYWVKVFNYVSGGDPKAMVVDVIFDPNAIDPDENRRFVEGVKKAGKIYNVLYFGQVDSAKWRYEMKTEPKGFDWAKFVLPFPRELMDAYPAMPRLESKFFELLNAGKSGGHANFDPDVDGVIRYIPLGRKFNGKFYPSVGLRAAYDIIGGGEFSYDTEKEILTLANANDTIKIPVDRQGRMLVTYQGGYRVFRNISFYDVLNERIPPEFFKDKIVIFGTSLAGLFDLRVTPVDSRFPGVAVHANIIYDVLHKDFTKKLPDKYGLIITIILAFIFSVLFVRFRPIPSVLSALAVIIFYLIVTFFIFDDSKLWVPVIEPIMIVLISFGVVFSYRYATEEKNKRFLKGVFSHYVTPSVVNDLLENPDKIKLGGERKICTVLFSDVQGFTTISEKLEPEELVALLNEYLTAMTNIVFKYDGMLDKYEGDAIMAVFGAPVSLENDSLNACLCALEMQEKLREQRKKWAEEGKPELYARVGLNTGPMVVGNMGGETRFDYTVMGDSVNLGARLEPANKEYGTFIMMGEETYVRVKDKILARKLDLLRVKGKEEPVGVYQVVDVLEKAPEEVKQVVDLFASGYAAYLMQNWDKAENYFKLALNIDPEDGPSKTYVKRCQIFRENPPAEDWDGVFTMTTK